MYVPAVRGIVLFMHLQPTYDPFPRCRAEQGELSMGEFPLETHVLRMRCLDAHDQLLCLWRIAAADSQSPGYQGPLPLWDHDSIL